MGWSVVAGYAFRLLLLASAAAHAPVSAQQVPEQVIIVTAPRSLPAPVRQLGRQEIDGYGAGSIGELLDEVLTEEGEDAPVVLINGRRASGLDELSDYPPEALFRLEVLAPGEGPKVGASPTQKVVNLVLARRFDGQVGRAAARTATDGGSSAVRADGTFTRIRGSSRFNLNLRARGEQALSEAERDITQPAGALASEGQARTLLPALRGTDLSLSGATRLGEGVDLSGTGRLSVTRRDAQLGLTPNGLVREQDSRVLGGRLNGTLNAEARGWTLALLGTVDADRRRVDTDFDDARRRSVIRSLATTLDLSAARSLLMLPAGPLQLNLGTTFTSDHYRSTTDRADDSSFTERSYAATAGLLLPIAGGPDDVLRPVGELNLSLDAGLTRVQEGGTFTTGSLGLVWEPAPWVRLSGGVSRASSPPAARFRREATALVTPGVLVFDPLTGESVRVDEISGPLATRARPRSEQQRLSLTLIPRSVLDLRLESEFSRRRERDVVGDLPLASSLVVAAFPERFLRDPAGVLTAVDVSPMLFPARSESQWRNAVSLRFRFDGGRGASGGEEEAAPTEEAVPRSRGARLQLTLSHTLLLSSRLTLRDGLPPIDLLSSNAVLFAGGRPRHQIDLSANLARAGMGLRLTAAYRSRSLVGVSDLAGAPQQLRFGALGTLSARAFAEAERLFGRGTLTKGTRFSLAITNLTNARERVVDGRGATPLAYQPAFRDALGRTVELEVRRSF